VQALRQQQQVSPDQGPLPGMIDQWLQAHVQAHELHQRWRCMRVTACLEPGMNPSLLLSLPREPAVHVGSQMARVPQDCRPGVHHLLTVEAGGLVRHGGAQRLAALVFRGQPALVVWAACTSLFQQLQLG
jgi:hypothetical protein